MLTAIRPMLDGGRYFEGPRWHAGRLWFVDCMERTLLSLDLSGTCERHATFKDDTPLWPRRMSGWKPRRIDDVPEASDALRGWTALAVCRPIGDRQRHHRRHDRRRAGARLC